MDGATTTKNWKETIVSSNGFSELFPIQSQLLRETSQQGGGWIVQDQPRNHRSILEVVRYDAGFFRHEDQAQAQGGLMRSRHPATRKGSIRPWSPPATTCASPGFFAAPNKLDSICSRTL